MQKYPKNRLIFYNIILFNSLSIYLFQFKIASECIIINTFTRALLHNLPPKYYYIMSTNFCESHSLEHTLFNLDKKVFICEKCALYDEKYKKDTLIERNMMKSKAEQESKELKEKI